MVLHECHVPFHRGRQVGLVELSGDVLHGLADGVVGVHVIDSRSCHRLLCGAVSAGVGGAGVGGAGVSGWPSRAGLPGLARGAAEPCGWAVRWAGEASSGRSRAGVPVACGERTERAEPRTRTESGPTGSLAAGASLCDLHEACTSRDRGALRHIVTRLAGSVTPRRRECRQGKAEACGLPLRPNRPSITPAPSSMQGFSCMEF